VKKVQIDESELAWRGFLIDEDAKAASQFFPRVTPATAHDDPSIVHEAWNRRRTIVTCNRQHFLRHIRQYQRRDNGKDCRDLWGLVVIPNLHLLREKRLSPIRHGLIASNIGLLHWPGVAFLNLYVHVNAERLDVGRFERCRFCEKDSPILEPWNRWYRSLPLVGDG
jgi:hypothetical protein